MKNPNALQFRVLSDEQCSQLLQAALECLERIGVQVNHAPARQLLAAAGGRVQENRVYIPAQVIHRAVAGAPHSVQLWDRRGAAALEIDSESVYFGPGPTCTFFYDPETGERRKARRGDAALTARVCDALENIDYAMSLSLFDDAPARLSSVYEFAEMAQNTTKPIAAWADDPAALQAIYRIAAAIAGGEAQLQARPFFACFTTYESPLRHAETSLANLLWAVEHHIPAIYLGGPTVGLESPATSAGALTLYLASALSGLAIAQLARPGAPVIIGGTPSAMDLRTARPAYGSPEQSLHTAAAADLARYLCLPFMGTAGASESKQVDAQAGAEIAMQIMFSMLSRAGLVHDVGFLDCADIGSLELLVLADEVIGMAKRIRRGIAVNRETIMLDLIERVGPGGHFIVEPESASRCRKEIWVPKIMDRNAYSIWEGKGSLDAAARVRERLKKILHTHQPAALPEEVINQIQEILSDAEKRF